MAVVTETTEAESAEQSANQVFPDSSDASDALPAKRKQGRPINPDKIDVPHLPKPPSYRPKPAAFFKYWREADAKLPNRITVYVYRRWPILDRDRVGKNRNIDKLSEPFPEEWEGELLHRHGSGDYRLDLNDVAFNKKLCECVVMGIRDPDYPPVVDLDELVVEDPANKSYVEYLRIKGQLHGAGSREDEMGNEALASALDSNRELTDKLIEVSTKQASEKSAQQQQPSLDAQAASMGMQIVKGAADMGAAIVNSATQKATEITAAISKGQSDPMETVKSFVTIAQSLNPKKEEGPDPMVAALVEESKALRGQLFQMMNARTESLEKELQAVRGNALIQQQTQATVPAQPAFQPRMIDDLDKILNVVDKLKASFGGGGEEIEKTRGSDNIWATILPMAIPMVTGIFGMISNIVYNYAASRTGQAPAPPPAIPAQAYTPEQMAEIAAGGMPTPTQGPGQEQPAVDGGNVYQRMLSQIKDPLLRCLENAEAGEEAHAGADFAYLLIQWNGRMGYDALRELGKETIIRLLQTYPPIWTEVVRVPSKFNVFLDGFMDADRIMKEDQDREDQLGYVETLPTPPAPVVPVTVKRKIKTVEATSEPGNPDPAPAS